MMGWAIRQKTVIRLESIADAIDLKGPSCLLVYEL
jgi:hypothetical protein